jgi:NTP pyrophosphatase (non-canonical NTP hydrolase)
MIDAKSYLNVTDRTCKHTLAETLDPFTYDMLHAALGISGEAGELLDAVKKSFIYRKVLDRENCKEELGDILWYIALACRTLGTTFEELMEQNIAKLSKRYPDKYSDIHAIARADKVETGETNGQ